MNKQFYVLNPVSGNAKTGPIPVSTSNSGTCPDACPIKLKGCYAKYGPVGMHWRKLDEGSSKNAKEWDEFLKDVKRIPRGSLWRHNQAGDLNGVNDVIDGLKLVELAKANKGKRGFTYTHYDVLHKDHAVRLSNQTSISEAMRLGFTINLSGNDVNHADNLKALDIAPVVVLMPRDAEKVSYTPAGNKVVICPAENTDKVTCMSCGLCQVVDRDYIIGFRAHGTAAKTVEIIARG